MSEVHVATEADNRRHMIHAAASLLKGTDSGTVEGVLAAAQKFHDWASSGASEPGKPAATRSRKAAEKPAETPPKQETKTDTAASEPDILGENAEEGFLTDNEPAAEPEKKATIEDVRAALLTLQKGTDAFTARTVLSKNADGADTLGKIKPEKFQAVIDAAKKQGTTKIAQAAK